MRLLSMLPLLAAVIAAPPARADGIRTVAPDAFDWVQTPEGVAFADLHGARMTGPYMSMVRLPGGTVSPPHIKSAAMFGVMISGTMTHVPAETAEAGTPLGAGAFYLVPADLAHVSSCISAEPCVTFLYQDGAFDFLPVPQ